METTAEQPTDDLIRVNLFLSRELRDGLKIAAIKHGKTMQEMASKVVADFLENQEAA